MTPIKKTSEGVQIKIFAQPNSSKNAFAGLYKEALKIKLAAPPVDGAANKMCVKFLGKSLKVPKGSVEIVSGSSSRNKRALVKAKSGKGFNAECARIARLIESFI